MRAPAPEGRLWIDGSAVDASEAALPLAEAWWTRGAGVFETLAVSDGCPLELDLHLERLEKGADVLRIPWPGTEPLTDWARLAARDGAGVRRWLKIVLVGSGRTIVFGGAINEAVRPMTAVLLPWQRSLRDPLVGLKTLNYAANDVGLQYAARFGADEGLWLNSRRHLAEACTANVFIVDRGKLFTPGVREGILAGVVRALTLQAARAVGLRVHEGRVRRLRLERATEAFLTSSLRGVCPLVRVGNRPVGCGEVGPITRRLADEVARMRGWSVLERPEPVPEREPT